MKDFPRFSREVIHFLSLENADEISAEALVVKIEGIKLVFVTSSMVRVDADTSGRELRIRL